MKPVKQNPYRSPAGVNVDSQAGLGDEKVARNIRAICILYVLIGGVLSLGSIGMFAAPEIPKIVALIVMVASVGITVSSIAILMKRSWGVPCCKIFSVLYLAAFPVGTILAAYFLLNVDKVRRRFV